MTISQSIFFRIAPSAWGRVADAYVPALAVLATGVLAFMMLTQEPANLGPLAGPADGGILLETAGLSEDRHGRVRSDGFGDGGHVRPAGFIVRGAFQGAY